MSVTIRAKLPKGDTNGLAHLEAKLAANPDEVLVVVALVRADTIEQRPHLHDDAVLVKTVMLHLEALDGKNAETTDKLLRKVYEARTGKRELPFEEPPPVKKSNVVDLPNSGRQADLAEDTPDGG